MDFSELKTRLCGKWEGTQQLFLEPPPVTPASSPARLSLEPVAGGCFLEGRYEWSHEGEVQHGLLLFGYNEENAATAAWVDSFHMSGKIMSCTGTAAAGAVDVAGTYEAPPGPDWGWRIAIRSLAEDKLEIVMHNIWPEGQTDLAVQADFTRCR